MKRPIIGIAMNAKPSFDDWFIDYYIDYFGQYERKCVIDAGGIPMGLPQTDNKEVIEGYLKAIDGLLVMGGFDISPALYGDEIHPLSGEITYERDDFEYILVTEAIKMKKPTILICRGMQMLNVVLGGTIYQDLSLNKRVTIKHKAWEKGTREVHSINVTDKKSLWYEIFKEDKMYVNSIHHQIIKDLAPALKIVATSPDGVIEIVEMKDSDQFLIGTQFHPEILYGRNQTKMLKLFEELIAKAQ